MRPSLANCVATDLVSVGVSDSKTGQIEPGLRISQPGVYYVYSSIHFKPNKPCSHFKYPVWEHRVAKISQDCNKQETLLKHYHSCCETCSMDEATSFTSGMFSLEQGDLIQVQLSERGLLNVDITSSYMGLVKHGQDG